MSCHLETKDRIAPQSTAGAVPDVTMGDLEEVNNLEAVTVRRLRKQNESFCAKLTEAKQMELSCQRCKERLMKKKEVIKASIQRRREVVEEVSLALPNSSRKLFDQLYDQVDEIYQSELLLLELHQQLMVAKATREEEAILRALGEVSHKKEGHMVDGDRVHILREWFQQISNVEKNFTPPTITSKNEYCADKDKVFYWAKYDETLPGNQASHQPALSFSTRHYGICLRLCISASVSRQTSETSCGCNPDTFTVTSDLPLEGLQLGLQRSIQERQLAHEFVIKTVWRLMQEQLVPLMSR